MRRKLRRLASSSRNARATVQGSDGRLLLCPLPSAPPVACFPVRACLAEHVCRSPVSRAPDLWRAPGRAGDVIKVIAYYKYRIRTTSYDMTAPALRVPNKA